jgi:hypothetical protein
VAVGDSWCGGRSSAGVARVGDGPGAGGAGGICGTRAEGGRERENDRGSEGDK